ncbi:hypothetical protein CTAYLR_005492 [Chrysophaeum taylorii]|uniref:PX domain-containing protein n=1 Tax=Chrysophaeum taylorii TaxID=2483200 RepID=A0AAD7XGC2_9STRA|nr:hypothetical protein CTAYLR_005492 [Chrysophaeum taylorii]
MLLTNYALLAFPVREVQVVSYEEQETAICFVIKVHLNDGGGNFLLVRRRYSTFHKLKTTVDTLPVRIDATFPAKTFVRMTRARPLLQRLAALDQWLGAVVSACNENFVGPNVPRYIVDLRAHTLAFLALCSPRFEV